jgi:hypothetical protein
VQWAFACNFDREERSMAAENLGPRMKNMPGSQAFTPK